MTFMLLKVKAVSTLAEPDNNLTHSRSGGLMPTLSLN